MRASATRSASTPDRLDPAYFERLFAGTGLAVFACDTTGRILGWNEEGERLFGRRPRAVESASVRDLLPEADRRVLDEQLKSLLETLEPTEFRTCLTDDSAGACEYAVWLAPVRGADGGLQGVSIWFHDITARLQLRRSMRKRERLTTLGALAGSIAHHYNNLLCGIATSLEFALNMNTPAAMRRSLQRTADAVNRAVRLTRQLLAFAQADYRAADQADLTEIVTYYCDQNEARLVERGVALKLDFQPLPVVALPREAMLIVLDNLVTNAVEAMPRGGTLTVGLRRRDEDRVVLSVGDTGAGIRPEHMERLFEPFFTTKGVLGAGGTQQAGMGLAVAYGLISEMHGLITASNAPGGGARFEVTLPITQPC